MSALNHVRWMDKCIYTLKIYLLSGVINSLPPGTVLDKRVFGRGSQQLPLIERLVQFVCFVYA